MIGQGVLLMASLVAGGGPLTVDGLLFLCPYSRYVWLYCLVD